jgi:hypothetical protein
MQSKRSDGNLRTGLTKKTAIEVPATTDEPSQIIITSLDIPSSPEQQRSRQTAVVPDSMPSSRLSLVPSEEVLLLQIPNSLLVKLKDLYLPNYLEWCRGSKGNCIHHWLKLKKVPSEEVRSHKTSNCALEPVGACRWISRFETMLRAPRNLPKGNHASCFLPGRGLHDGDYHTETKCQRWADIIGPLIQAARSHAPYLPYYEAHGIDMDTPPEEFVTKLLRHIPATEKDRWAGAEAPVVLQQIAIKIFQHQEKEILELKAKIAARKEREAREAEEARERDASRERGKGDQTKKTREGGSERSHREHRKDRHHKDGHRREGGASGSGHKGSKDSGKSHGGFFGLGGSSRH